VNLAKSIRNLPSHACLPPEGLNVYDILDHGVLVIAKDVVKAVEARVVAAETVAASV
jgi:large subunit ribosomal protein L4